MSRRVAIAILFAAWAPAMVAQADCTKDEKVAMARSGFPYEEIERICSESDYAQDQGRPPNGLRPSYAPRNQAPAIATFCATNVGPCPMMVAIPVGSSCFCAGPFGPMPGIAR